MFVSSSSSLGVRVFLGRLVMIHSSPTILARYIQTPLKCSDRLVGFGNLINHRHVIDIEASSNFGDASGVPAYR
jgi:hypothetical protein